MKNSKELNNLLIISPAPHIRKKGPETRCIMLEVILALSPVILASIYFFGLRSLLVLLTCVISCVLTEIAFEYLRGVKITITDFSAVVTGILLALILPPTIPLWAAALGAIVSISLAKQLFGGLGYNIFNPALIGRAFLAASFPSMMTKWVEPFSLDAVTQATPLGLMKFSAVQTDIGKLFLGNVSGSLGETSALAILMGGLYLIIRGRADWRIPLSFLSATFVFSLVSSLINPNLGSPLFHLLSGGLLIGAFFMATDPVTTPLTKSGRFIFGVGAGIMVMIIRIFGGLPEGVMYSILLMNSVTPLINRYTIPKPFGG
jgi:electron transport complex protein RnfD